MNTKRFISLGAQLALCSALWLALWLALLAGAALAQQGGGSFDPTSGFEDLKGVLKVIVMAVGLGVAAFALVYSRIAKIVSIVLLASFVLFLVSDPEGTMGGLGEFLGSMLGFGG